MDASHVYVRALALGCFYSHISAGTFRRALTALLDSCAKIKSGVTKSGRVWRKMPESDARGVAKAFTSSSPPRFGLCVSQLIRHQQEHKGHIIKMLLCAAQVRRDHPVRPIVQF